MDDSSEDRDAQQIAEGLKHGDMPYHSVPELEIVGRRDNAHRLKQLNLPSMAGQTCYDIGCNSGFFCDAAIDRGARRAIGIDTEKTIQSARAIHHKDGVFLMGYDANELTAKRMCEISRSLLDGVGDAGVILFLSMFKLMGIPHFLSVAQHVIIENNNTKYEDYIFERLHRLGFARRERTGYTTDFGKRSIIKAWK